MSSSVISLDRIALERELTPILTQLLTLAEGNYQDPVINQFFKWLLDTKCTGEEFNYVIGDLAHSIAEDENHVYLCIVAAQALSVKSPILETLPAVKSTYLHQAYYNELTYLMKQLLP